MARDRSHNPWIAGILSALWPGAGHSYNGDSGRFLALLYLIALGCVVVIPIPQDGRVTLSWAPWLSGIAVYVWTISAVAIPITWLYALVDAVQRARSIARVQRKNYAPSPSATGTPLAPSDR